MVTIKCSNSEIMIEQSKNESYQNIKGQLDKILVPGVIPNIKGIKKIIATLKKRIKILETGTMFFCNSDDQFEKSQLAIARLSGELQAYQERYNEIQEKLRQNC